MYEPTKLVTKMTNPLHRGSSSTCWVLVRDLAIKMYFFGVISWMQIILTKFLTNLFDEFFDEWQTTSSGPYFVLLPLFWAAQNNYCIEPGFQDVNFLSFFTFTTYYFLCMRIQHSCQHYYLKLVKSLKRYPKVPTAMK